MSGVYVSQGGYSNTVERSVEDKKRKYIDILKAVTAIRLRKVSRTKKRKYIDILVLPYKCCAAVQVLPYKCCTAAQILYRCTT